MPSSDVTRARTSSFVNGFDESVVVDVDGLGPTRFVHGSPRSDEEWLTPVTPAERVGEFMAGVPERVVVTAHVHVSYDRHVGELGTRHEHVDHDDNVGNDARHALRPGRAQVARAPRRLPVGHPPRGRDARSGTSRSPSVNR